MNILAHTCFIGTTGYANHARSFFCALNKYHTVKVRNETVGKTWKGYNMTPHDEEPYMTDEMKSMLYQQTLINVDNTRTSYPIYSYNSNFKPDVHIILMDMNHYFFYENYDGYKIAYNVWESTRYPNDFFKRLFYFDEVWVPTQWQFDCLIEQGYPANKISIVPEGIDVDIFKPLDNIPVKNKFRFLLMGRWEWRKSTTEIIKTFEKVFKKNDNVELLCSVDNPFPSDGLKSTEERIKFHNINSNNIEFVSFPPREQYIQYMREGDVLISCSRSEGWGLPLIESLSCGTPALYSNWGAQLQFAKNKGIPVDIVGLVPANFEHKDWPGEYCEPDFEDLGKKMLMAYDNYEYYKNKALNDSKLIHEEFNWDIIAKNASNILNKKILKPQENINTNFVFVTAASIEYMPIVEKLVKSILEFSKAKIIVYGINCEVPFNYSNLIKKTLNPPYHSKYDMWYWKQYACIESLKEDFEYFIWVDGDNIVNYNIDNIEQYFKEIENYPISDIHLLNDYYGYHYDNNINISQSFNENLCKQWNLQKKSPLMHICLFIYNKNCKWWFEKIIERYLETPLEDYITLFLWNDEGIDNALRWEYDFTKHLPQVSNFDTSSYDGNLGFTNQSLHQFFKFYLERGPQNFNQIYGFQYFPKDKETILYFHGNKDINVAQQMIDFIKMKKDNTFYLSKYFFTDIYKLENFNQIDGILGSTMFVAEQYGWPSAIFHEIYNLQDYYLNREKRIFDGDIVVDIGANIGVFTRWALKEGAFKVISFEPDKRYFKLLDLNSDPNKTILFNAAVSNEIGEICLYETEHLGGSTIIKIDNYLNKYNVRTYTLNYLFDSGLITKIDFLKIDAEGAEINIFNGISDENLMKIKNIAMEYHHSHLGFDDNLRANLIKRLNNVGFNSHLLFLGGNNSQQMIYFWK
jgi:FkbM family methyltransferase